jgi:ABC-type branched-subunit amino acid transport system ATPase component
VPDTDLSQRAATALAVADLRAWYGRAQALFGVSLAAATGEVVGLLGRNGAGKTTTLLSLMGVEVRCSGTVSYFGDPVGSRSATWRARRGMAWVPDDRRVFGGLTVRSAARGRSPLAVGEVVDLLPMLGDLLDKDGRGLSGGQQQAVSIARALVSRPRLLLLDEPMEGLAPVVVAELETAIAALPERTGVTVVIAEQNLDLVLGLSHRVYVLDGGTVVHSSTAAEFAGRTDLQDRWLSVGESARATHT